MTITQTENKVRSKIDRFYHGRFLSIFRHMTNSLTEVEGLRVAKNWPAQGSISFTRTADGKRVRIWLDRKPGGKWMAEAK